MAAAPDYILSVLQWLCLLAVSYYYMLTYLGLARPSRPPAAPPATGFALLIPAHNEEKVLPPLLESIALQEYPRELIEVYVVADNCTDGTARVAARAGATVLERTSPLRGKGYALQFGLREILNRSRCAAVCILDADNLLDPLFLSSINARLLAGARVVQGRVETKNPLDSWVSASYAINFWLANRLWQLGRARAGLSGLLCGTGMCFRREVLAATGWPATSLTEDLEYTVVLISRGIKVTWAHEAVVFDEKPDLLGPSCRQRLRWLQGKWQILFSYGPRLFMEALALRSWARADALLFLLQPALLLAGPACALSAALHPHTVVAVTAAREENPFLLALALIPYLLPLIAMYLEKAPAKAYLYLPAYTFFSFTWIPITLAGLLTFWRRAWYRTPHTRAITLEQRTHLYSLRPAGPHRPGQIRVAP
ncbi:MAG: glycosyltransferase family 2 protein [Bacillota bacterium]